MKLIITIIIIIISVAIETLRPLDLRRAISETRLEAKCWPSRETEFLFQRLSMAIQWFNLVALFGTFPSATEDEA